MRVARAWRVSPAELRHVTLAEFAAMVDVLNDETRRR